MMTRRENPTTSSRRARNGGGPSGFAARGAVLLWAMIVSAVLPCCSPQPKPSTDSGGVAVALTPPPTPAQIAAVYNPRVERLDRLWASTELRIRGLDEQGQEFNETAEGYVQVIRPSRLALAVKKVGETYFSLGSNESHYWWMDLRKPSSAIVGTHSKATPEVADRFGVPVHPLDLIELLGVIPLEVRDAKASRSPDGTRVIVTSPARWGMRQWSFSNDSTRLLGVRLLTTDGRVLCESELGEPMRVAVREDAAAIAYVPERLRISLPSRSMELSMRLYRPENRGAAMNPAAFDLQKLLKAYRIETSMVRDIDREIPTGPTQARDRQGSAVAPASGSASNPPVPPKTDASRHQSPKGESAKPESTKRDPAESPSSEESARKPFGGGVR